MIKEVIMFKIATGEGHEMSLWELNGFLATFDTAGEFVMQCGS
jgi:hypothetical protein